MSEVQPLNSTLGGGFAAPTEDARVMQTAAALEGFLRETNRTDGTLRITAGAAYPEIYPLTVRGTRGRNEPAELAVPPVLRQKRPALTTLEGSPAYNVGRAYAAFAADINNGTHRPGLHRRRRTPHGPCRDREIRANRGTREDVVHRAEPKRIITRFHERSRP